MLSFVELVKLANGCAERRGYAQDTELNSRAECLIDEAGITEIIPIVNTGACKFSYINPVVTE